MGRNFTNQFERNNPDYIHAGERPSYYRERGGPGSIDARAGESMPGTGPGTGKTSIPMGRGFGGVNNFWMLQHKDVPAFQNPHAGVNWGLGNSAQEMGARMTQAGNMLLGDGRYVPDTMYTRTMGSMMPPVANQPQGPTPDQMRWAQAFANSQPAANPVAPADQSLAGAAFGNNLIAQTPVTPTNFSRAALIEGAKKSGEFGDIMNAYNRNAAGTGYRMDENGSINPLPKVAGKDDKDGTSPFARDVYGAGAEDIRARRDFARGEAPVSRGTENGVPTLTKLNPYGTASATIGGPSIGVRQGMMPDPLNPGQMMPMRQWAADQSAVQATKYGPDAGQAGENYLSRPAIAGGIASALPPRPSVKAPSATSALAMSPGVNGTIRGLPLDTVPASSHEKHLVNRSGPVYPAPYYPKIDFNSPKALEENSLDVATRSYLGGNKDAFKDHFNKYPSEYSRDLAKEDLIWKKLGNGASSGEAANRVEYGKDREDYIRKYGLPGGFSTEAATRWALMNPYKNKQLGSYSDVNSRLIDEANALHKKNQEKWNPDSRSNMRYAEKRSERTRNA